MSTAYLPPNPSFSLSTPSANFIRKPPGRTTPPPKYTLISRSIHLHTLQSINETAKPRHIHLIPVVHTDASSPDAVEHALCSAHPPPEVLVLELCARRAALLESPSAARKPLHRPGPWNFRRLLKAWLDAQVAGLEGVVNGTSPVERGAELRRAADVFCTQLGDRRGVVLGDRRVDDTLRMWARDAGWRERLYLAVDIAVAPVVSWLRPSLHVRLATPGVLAEWRANLRDKAPVAFRVLCELRERHMTWAVRDCTACMGAGSVALVCGAAHYEDILRHLQEGTQVFIEDLDRDLE